MLAVTAPLLFTRSGFAVDFTNHLWLVWVAGKALAQAGHPTYFFNTTTQGVFNPWFAFYGGTLYMATGAISELLGEHPVVAYVGVTVAATAACYGGMLWLSRELGLRRWSAHAPALTVVTSAYYISDLYGRGAWPEFIAASAIAPLIAGGVWLIRAPTWRPWPVLVFVTSAVVFTGSHNITLLWGMVTGALALLCWWLAMGRPLGLPYRRIVMVAGLGVTAALVNAWFLLTDIAHAGDVAVNASLSSQAVALSTSFLDTPAVLLDPLRHVPAQSSSPALYVQAPDWFLLWGLLVGILLMGGRSMSRGLRRAWIAATAVIALLLGMIMLRQFWEHVPYPLTAIQFPYRLNTFLVYAVAGLVLVAGLALQQAASSPRLPPARTVRGLKAALIATVAVSVALCLWQEWVPNPLFPIYSYEVRNEALVSVNKPPRTWYDAGSYTDASAPVVPVPPGRVLTIPPSAVHGDRFAALMEVPPGPQPIETNIAGGDYVVGISGLHWVGRNAKGFAVVQRPNGGSGPVHVVVKTASSRAITLGWILSILALVAILLVLIYTGVGTRRGDT